MYLHYEGEPFYGRININYRIQYVRDIYNRLPRSDWESIMKSPFGKIMKMFLQVAFSSQIMHAVLFKQLDCKKEWETWYEIAGKEARFSMCEFCLISGLKCGPLPEVDIISEKMILKTFFGRSTGAKVTVQTLYETFREYKRMDNYKYRLALLLIVEGVLLGGDKGRQV